MGMSFLEVAGWDTVDVTHAKGRGSFVLLCEHAGLTIPEDLAELGLEEPARSSHAAWDIGARDLAEGMAKDLDAPLIAGRLSRLVYDLNRPLEAPDCIPAQSERFAVPGNAGLSDSEKRARFEAVHEPFHAAVSAVLDARETAALVTVHSFTPVYMGVPREVELGFLHHADSRLAEAALRVERTCGSYRAAINEPYDASDGVTYSLRKHGEARGLPSVMIEVRNDLVDTPAKAQAMAVHLSATLKAALAAISPAEAAL